MRTRFVAELSNLTWQLIYIWGRGLFLGISQASTPRGQGLSSHQFLWFLSTYPHTFRRKTTKFHVVTHMGRGFVLGGQPSPYTARGRDARAPNFRASFYLCVQSLSQKCQIWRGYTRWEGACILGSAKLTKLPSSPILEFSCIYAYTIWRRPNSAW